MEVRGSSQEAAEKATCLGYSCNEGRACKGLGKFLRFGMEGLEDKIDNLF